jgi:hypothetical protein
LGGGGVDECECSFNKKKRLYLVKGCDGFQVLSVTLWRRQARIELEAADDVEDGVLGEHELEKSVLVLKAELKLFECRVCKLRLTNIKSFKDTTKMVFPRKSLDF